MDTPTLQQVQDALSKNEEVAIVVGKNQNLDSMGGALALYLALKTVGKHVSIASPSEPLVEISSLVGIDRVKTYFETAGGDLVVSFPYSEGEIEKVSYTLENGFLNIIVKAGEKGLSFREKDVQYKRGQSGSPKLLFIIGTQRLSDLGNLFDPQALKNTTVINIDNKADNQGFGDIVLASQTFSSVSEQVANILTFLDLPFDIDIAQNLFSGITFATENFQSPKTSALAFETAAVLLKKGAIRKTARIKTNMPSEGSFFTQPQRQRDRNTNPFKPKSPFSFPRPQQQPIAPSRNVAPMPSISVPPTVIEEKDNQNQPEETPPDWLTPKVYKGSTLV